MSTTPHRDDLGPVAYSAYSRGCRCLGCRAEKARYVADRRARGDELDPRRRHDRARTERRPRVDNAALLEHLIALHRLGWTDVAIAAAASIDAATPSRIVRRNGTINRRVHAAILAVPLITHVRHGRELRTCPCGVEFDARRSDPRIHHTKRCAQDAVAGHARDGVRRFTDAELIGWMRRAATGRDVLSSSAYDLFRASEPAAPHSRTLVLRYQGWANAVRAAGLNPGRSDRSYNRRFTADQIIAAVRRALADGVRTADDYERWARQRPDQPSLSNVRFRLNLWSTAVTLATERTAS